MVKTTWVFSPIHSKNPSILSMFRISWNVYRLRLRETGSDDSRIDPGKKRERHAIVTPSVSKPSGRERRQNKKNGFVRLPERSLLIKRNALKVDRANSVSNATVAKYTTTRMCYVLRRPSTIRLNSKSFARMRNKSRIKMSISGIPCNFPIMNRFQALFQYHFTLESTRPPP
uniref:Uncharacterized protein n=1 Tax=Candidatus Kentrum sp. MB TaxID=2138164 RepID=A0A450XX27_9GAMM|nr:MAG: hypothetical protein BECKMB1821I_GA0114274_105418 [Candidatus Kentron sp. MB]VFK76438.1 MAG: hypothetical protein BECKMB1821H_GA0114242_105619 [Candidatus Kentron sp. MB]